MPRMLLCLLVSIALFAMMLGIESLWPGSQLAVTLNKAHLMSLGGWGGYWLDRWLFPYARPHAYLIDAQEADPQPIDVDGHVGYFEGAFVPNNAFDLSMLRRAVVVGCA